MEPVKGFPTKRAAFDAAIKEAKSLQDIPGPYIKVTKRMKQSHTIEITRKFFTWVDKDD